MGLWADFRAAVTLARRVEDLRADVAQLAKATDRRMSELEADIGYVNKQVQRLRGRVTGGIRNAQDPQDSDSEGNDDAVGLDDINERIRRGELGYGILRRDR